MTYFEHDVLTDTLLFLKDANEKGLTIEELISELEIQLKEGE